MSWQRSIQAAVRALRSEEQQLVRRLDHLRGRIAELTGVAKGARWCARHHAPRGCESTVPCRATGDLAGGKAPLGEVPLRKKSRRRPTRRQRRRGERRVAELTPRSLRGPEFTPTLTRGRSHDFARRSRCRQRGCSVPLGLHPLLADRPGLARATAGPLRETVVHGNHRAQDRARGDLGRDQRRGRALRRSASAERQSMVAETKSVLDLAADDDKVAAILLRIDSPGGSVSASDTLYHEILTWKDENKKPVVRVLQRNVDVGRVLPRDGGRPHRRAPGVGHRLDRRDHARHQHRGADGQVRRRGPDADERAVTRTPARCCATCAPTRRSSCSR